jgi:hypothetical protein
MALSAGVITALSSALSGLSSNQIKLFGGLTQAQEMAALEVLDNMSSNPATAASLLPELTAVPNVPAVVTNWVNMAISTPAQFANYMAQAKSALLSTAISALSL